MCASPVLRRCMIGTRRIPVLLSEAISFPVRNWLALTRYRPACVYPRLLAWSQLGALSWREVSSPFVGTEVSPQETRSVHHVV